MVWKDSNRNRRGFRFRLDTDLMALFPLLVIIAYWSNMRAVLVVVTVIFPFLLALDGISNRWRARQADMGPQIDPLTGLPNRQAALARLDEYLNDPSAKGHEKVVLVVDIDRFRTVNERFGLTAGDKVLREIGERLGSCLRDGDIVCRIDGDGFALIPRPIRRFDIAIAISIAERVQAAIAQPFVIDDVACHLSCSVGVCVASRAPGSDANSLMEGAETALTMARRSGPAAIRYFTPDMKDDSRRLIRLSDELQDALENAEIRPWFQPQICTDTGEVVGFEALARWEHPRNGVMTPAGFMPMIEASGQSERLSEIILFHGLNAIRAWDKAGFRVPSLGVNFSARDLQNPRLTEKIKWETDRFDIAPCRITIEILEDVIWGQKDDVMVRNIRSLAAQGFNIDLDDFGTGNASIANLRRFPVSRIKIDRSFVTGLDHDPNQRAMTAAIIRMAESLGIETLAEGVETIGEQECLARLGCRQVQGFGIARPMPMDDTLAWLAQHREKLQKGAGPARRAG